MKKESHDRQAIRKRLLPQFEEVVDAVLKAHAVEDSTKAELEIARAGDRLGAEAIGQWLTGFDLDAPRIEVDGKSHYRLGAPVDKTYQTQRGEVRIMRRVYRPSGEHNGAIVCPLEVRVGMVGGQWTPGCAEAMAYVAQEVPERAAAKIAQKMGAMDYSSSSFKRVARTLGERWEAERDRWEEATIQAVEIPETAARLAVSIDRVSLLMDESDESDESDGLCWRMAYCAALTLCDQSGAALKTLRYGRMPGEGAHILREQMQWDVRALTSGMKALEVVTLSDGAAEMCRILDQDYPEAPRLVDFYHVVEKLSAALVAYWSRRGAPGKAKKMLEKWKTKLLNEPGAIEKIERTITHWRAGEVDVGGQKPVHQALTYIAHHKAQMNYAEARAQGRPIGSGHVEACCKQLVQVRMKRNGQRWKARGGQAILTLRSLATDARWDPAMRAMLPSFKRQVEVVGRAA